MIMGGSRIDTSLELSSQPAIIFLVVTLGLLEGELKVGEGGMEGVEDAELDGVGVEEGMTGEDNIQTGETGMKKGERRERIKVRRGGIIGGQ